MSGRRTARTRITRGRRRTGPRGRLAGTVVVVGREQDQGAVSEDVQFAVHGPVVESVIVVLRVEERFFCQYRILAGFQFVFLHQKGGVGEEFVAAGVIEVELGC